MFLSCFYGLLSLYLLRFDDTTYSGSLSGTATAGCNLEVERPADVSEGYDGHRRSGESMVVGLRSLLTRSFHRQRIYRHISKTVVLQASFHKINLERKQLHV